MIHRKKEATARDVYEYFGKELSLSAIQTYLKRMVQKGLISRRVTGRTFWYQATERQDALFARLFRQLRAAIPQRPGEVLAHMAGEGELDDDDVKQLKTIIRQHEGRKAGRSG